MNTLVTIGIPCFNSERWLAQAITSALKQSWSNCEVIVVDDGSTDGSVDVARSFGQKVKLLASEHQGANHARNRILQEAQGEWIQYLDADDYLESGKITQQFSEGNAGAEADVIYSPVWIETTTGTSSEREQSRTSPDLDIYAQWLAWQIPQTGGCLWRRSALLSLGGWKDEQPCCQEHELYLRGLQAGLRFVYTPTPHAVYRVWSEETLCRRDPRLVIAVKTRLIDVLESWMLERKLWSDVHRRTAGRACFEMARTIAKYNFGQAVAYHQERQSRKLIHLEGPAAPKFYRWIYNALGFATAERLAAISR
ncbi:MAG TPA: glycosyltransferase [Chthoniobacteraceae bacterium]|jgi:glycosyltransferase involved in cell wall biosynthesis